MTRFRPGWINRSMRTISLLPILIKNRHCYPGNSFRDSTYPTVDTQRNEPPFFAGTSYLLTMKLNLRRKSPASPATFRRMGREGN